MSVLRRGKLESLAENERRMMRVQLPVQPDEAAHEVRLSFTAQGSSVAAWLVRKHRDVVKRDGVFAVEIPRAVFLSKKAREEFVWFFVGIARLRRSEKWEVRVRETDDGRRSYAIRWELRGCYARPT